MNISLPKNTFNFKNRDDWRNWLEENFKTEKEIWLIYFKKHTKKLSVSYDEAVEEALCFGWIDSTVKTIDDERYMQKYTPRNENSIWSKVNKKRAEKMLEQDKMTEHGMKLVEVAKKNGNWDKAYSSSDNYDMPKELLNELKKYISEGDYLLVYEGIPLIHFLTKTKPYLDNPWVDLYRLDIFLKKFEHALKQRPILPVIVRAKANTSTETWPKGIVSTLSQKNRYVQKRPIWDKFVTSNQYSIVWENDFFEILITGIN